MRIPHICSIFKGGLDTRLALLGCFLPLNGLRQNLLDLIVGSLVLGQSVC